MLENKLSWIGGGVGSAGLMEIKPKSVFKLSFPEANKGEVDRLI